MNRKTYILTIEAVLADDEIIGLKEWLAETIGDIKVIDIKRKESQK